jgi:hypothetical protein
MRLAIRRTFAASGERAFRLIFVWLLVAARVPGLRGDTPAERL